MFLEVGCITIDFPLRTVFAASQRFWIFPGGSDGKASAYNAYHVGDLGSIPGSGRSPGEGNGNSFQYSCLENPMDGGTWWATVHGVAKSLTRLSDFTHSLKGFRSLYFCFHLPLGTEKAMATHSSTLAWKIPWTEGPGRLQSMGSLGVGHD